jgi:UDP-N-acetylglucosamine--N-acetylmuramyl-(pentapeptide) pyrophosphoryl-undecaprenol N-acetylglucosamine transferase
VREVLSQEDPRLVVGTGGYVSGPVVWAATQRGVPAVLQEQNAVPGLATRRLARRARQIHLGFPEARRRLRPGPGTEVLDTGNPRAPPPETRPDGGEARRSFGFAADRPMVLAMGGSQGAVAVNRAIEGALLERAWPAAVQLLWQTGTTSFDQFRRLAKPGEVEVRPYLDPIQQAYAAADLVVSRAGAMTLAEIAAWALPSVLIPLPVAAGGHQHANARAHADYGAAVLLEQREASGRALGQAVAALIGDPARMASMAEASGRRSRPGAAAEVARRALELVFNS